MLLTGNWGGRYNRHMCIISVVSVLANHYAFCRNHLDIHHSHKNAVPVMKTSTMHFRGLEQIRDYDTGES